MSFQDHDIETIRVVERAADQVLDVTLCREVHLLFDSASLEDFPGKSVQVSFFSTEMALVISISSW